MNIFKPKTKLALTALVLIVVVWLSIAFRTVPTILLQFVAILLVIALMAVWAKGFKTWATGSALACTFCAALTASVNSDGFAEAFGDIAFLFLAVFVTLHTYDSIRIRYRSPKKDSE